VGNDFITYRENLALSLQATHSYCGEPLVDIQQQSPLEINLEIDEHLGEMDLVYTLQDSDVEEKGLASGVKTGYGGFKYNGEINILLFTTKIFRFPAGIFGFGFVVGSYLLVFS